jgi:4-alpha-glucanotransferase
MYTAKGQRWGMPTYNWEMIEKDGFRYLKEKLKYAQNFYDILRIDHVVGLFRIWSIPYNEPLENQGLNGFFDPTDETLWRAHGRKILSVINESTSMLICAEDLGVIPKACTETLEELGIPGNDVQRWVKDWRGRHDFLPSVEYRNFSVAMLSTHDTTNWAAWWENEAGTVDEAMFVRKCNDRSINYQNVRERLFDLTRSGHGRMRWLEEVDSADKLIGILGKERSVLADFIDIYENTYREKEKLWKQFKLPGAIREKCDRQIVEAAFKVTISSRSIFDIETIIDWLYLGDIFKGDPYQYRINTPGTVSKDNWSLRIPVPLEELIASPLCEKIKKMVKDSGRA